MEPLNQLSGATLSELQQMLRWWREVNRSGGTLGLIQPDKEIHDRHVRWARTTTNAAFPSYPASPVDVIVCELGKYDFVNTAVADVSPAFTPYVPQKTRLVFFPDGWVAEGTVVRITLHNGKWFAIQGSSRCDFIRFEILEVGTNARGIRWARVEVLSRPSGGCVTVPEESAGEVAKVYDMAGCKLNEPNADLIGRIGYAKYMQDERFLLEAIEPGGPVPDEAWEVVDLCCPSCVAV